MNHYDFDGRVALVTGAGSGIGEACATTFARGGARVVVSDIDARGGTRVVEAIEKSGGEARFVRTDVADPEAVRALVDEAVTAYGKLDVAVNNAGIGGDIAPVAEYGIDSWRRVIDVNLNSAFYGMRYEIARMLEGGGGAIVNMASILGWVGFAQSSAYVTAKHGLLGLTQTAALEYSSQGVRVNAVGPGFIKTPMIDASLDAAMQAMLVGMHPIGRLGVAQEVANLVAFLCSDDASFITGSYYTVDGGYTAQ